MNTLLILSIAAIFGLLSAAFLRRFKMPSVTGYLIAGLVIGPSVLNIIPHSIVDQISIISDLALGLIAFHIGENFELSRIKQLARRITSITVIQATFTFIAVSIILCLATKDIIFSLVIGSISAATAPAATMMVIKEYKSKGRLTDTLISVVALDDVMTIIIFSIVTAICEIIRSGNTSFKEAVVHPSIEIFGSIGLGAVLGLIISYSVRKRKARDFLLVNSLALIVLGIGVSLQFDLSALLTCVSMGSVLTNFSGKSTRVFDEIESFAVPVYLLFFTISGMHLEIGVIKEIGITGVVYIFARTAGKIGGAYLGALLTKSSAKVKHFLGFGLLPQAGVAIGLAVIASEKFPEYGTTITNMVMLAVFFYEIVGPFITKSVLIKSGEAQEIRHG
ncbi:transporter, CPA2 family [Dethiosulfatibacter aminovorans DSM 17477]|uniref:Transporter, CPA2 family n=1 Tax=Dethiosulfatibacter aminovorans DSM 17477 TaxID=1121476 RepID=A0A1M6H4C5_9FIRM|nr:cation:proton antiporter [Dethiosulfatibacter aminovorans]SHJ17023.1 transporter, CPA2 family [Dethiosulfatibacter aminovorans DSM 17477]